LPEPQAAPAAPAAPVVAVVTAEPTTMPLAQQLRLDEIFLADGTFTRREPFRYHTVAGGALLFRSALLEAIAAAPIETIQALPERARKTMFAVVKGEKRRYFGTEVRRQDSADGQRKAGDPLPRLVFQTPAVAVAYREKLRAATNKLLQATYGTQANLWLARDAQHAASPATPTA
jgi:hypothetical protein